jgi:hypothetical protein
MKIVLGYLPFLNSFASSMSQMYSSLLLSQLASWIILAFQGTLKLIVALIDCFA